MTQSEAQDFLVVKRLFSAPIERVFEAWTKAEVLAKWFGPEGFLVSRSEINVRVGGTYEIEIHSPEGNRIRHFGSYVEVSEPHRLIFTWMLEDQACKGSEGLCAETLVSIDFKCFDQTTTEITLTHERLPNKEAYDGHKFGWNSSFDSLQALFKTAGETP